MLDKQKTVLFLFSIIIAILLFIMARGSTIKKGEEIIKQDISKPISTVALQEEEFLPMQDYRILHQKLIASLIKLPKRVIQVATTRGSSTKLKPIGTFEATAYCPCKKCCGENAKGITASGTKVQANRTIAVDPKVIPLGSKVHIEGYGDYVAEDKGGAIKGNKIDIFFPDHQSALNFGRKKGIKVYWR
jgi:3D (Asp-Asp-Asp) domain-containing protein